MISRMKLKGKHVILSIDEDALPYLKPLGIEGSPVFAKVYKQEENGVWLETKRFKTCPPTIPKLYDATGDAFCRAHIFVPSKAIVAIVAFPGDASHLESDPNLHPIGFAAGQRRKKGPKSSGRKS